MALPEGRLTSSKLVAVSTSVGVGAQTAPGHVVHLGDSFQAIFNIGLQQRKNFTFTVDAYGVDPVTHQAIHLSQIIGSFKFDIHDLGYSFYLPVITH